MIMLPSEPGKAKPKPSEGQDGGLWAKSGQSAAGTFSAYKYGLKYEVDHERFLRLLAARAVVSHIVKHDLMKPGDYRLRFVPTEGGAFQFIHRNVRLTDTVAFKIFSDEVQISEGSRQIVIGEYRHKSTRSQIDSQMRDFGAGAFARANLNYASVATVMETFEKSRKRIGETEKEDFSSLHQRAKSRLGDREKLLLEACGGDSSKLAKVKAELAQIGAIVSEINKVKEEGTQQKGAEPPDLPSAASLWPVTEKIASDVASTFPHREEFADWVYQYVREMKKSLGVDALEYSTLDALWDLEHVLERVRLDSPDKANFWEKYERLMRKAQEITNRVRAIDHRMEKLASKAICQPEDFTSICQVAVMRLELLRALRELHSGAECFNHMDYNCGLMKTIIATMAANLCRVSDEEIKLWQKLWGGQNFQQHLKGRLERVKEELDSQNRALKKKKVIGAIEEQRKDDLKDRVKQLEKAPKDIRNFIEAVGKENALIAGMHEAARSGHSDRNVRVKQLEEKLVARISGLQSYSPALHKILIEAYHESKSHQEYKRGRRLCQDMNYYLSASELLYSIFETDGTQEHEGRLQAYLKENAMLFNLFEKYGLRDEIMMHLGMFLHIKERPFDIESDALAIQKSGYSGTILVVKYALGTDTASGERCINLTFGNHALSVVLPPPMALEQAQAASKKSLSEELYGDSFPLHFVLGDENVKADALGTIYEKIATASLGGLPKFREIRERLRHKSLGTAHFPYLLAHRKKLAGCTSNVFGENQPEALGGQNSFMDALRANYPNFEKEAREADDYLFHKTTIRLFRELNRTLPYWFERCIEEMAKKSAQAQEQG